MKKTVPILVSFIGGFLVHMFLFSDLLPDSAFPNRPAAAKSAQTGAAIPTPEFAKSMVYIEYKDGKFTPRIAVSKVGNHILIRNMDPKKTMYLDSDASGAAFFKTTRPYGLSEQIDVVPQKSGTFKATNKENTDASFTVIVKP